MPDKNIGKRIKKTRKEHKESQQTLADILEKKQSGVSAMENGNKQITLQDIIKICEHYNVSADYIIFGKGRKNDIELNEIGMEFYETILETLKKKYPKEQTKTYEETENL